MSAPQVYRNQKSFSIIQFTFAFSIVFILVVVMTIQSAFASGQEDLEREHLPDAYQGGLILSNQAQIHNSCRVSWSEGEDSDLTLIVETEKAIPPLNIYSPLTGDLADIIELNPIFHSSHPFSLKLNTSNQQYEGSSTFRQSRQQGFSVTTDTKITLYLSFDLAQKKLTITQQAYFIYGVVKNMTTNEKHLLTCLN